MNIDKLIDTSIGERTHLVLEKNESEHRRNYYELYHLKTAVQQKSNARIRVGGSSLESSSISAIVSVGFLMEMKKVNPATIDKYGLKKLDESKTVATWKFRKDFLKWKENHH